MKIIISKLGVFSAAPQAKRTEFMTWVDTHRDSRWVYRGLGDTSFKLLTGAGRSDRYSLTKDEALFKRFERLASEFIDTRRAGPWDLLALAQNHWKPAIPLPANLGRPGGG